MTFLFSVLFTFMLQFGTDSIFDFIEANATKIEKRTLEFGLDEVSRQYYVKNDDDNHPIKVLQLSDIHLSAGVLTTMRDRLVVASIIQAVQNTKPDIIVLTGDAIYPSVMALTLNNKHSSRAIGKLFETFQIPWAIVYGNHDATSFSTQSKTELSNYFESLEYCLFQKGPSDITGQGNYIIRLLSSSGALESALVLMDSNTQSGFFEYDIVHDDQVEWYSNQIAALGQEAGKTIPTHLFLHIPMYEYRLAWEQYLGGGEDIIYHYGSKDQKRIASASNSRGKLFEKMVELGSTKTVFVGHDHTHNFSITYKGIRLTYGMSMDYTAYVYTYFTNEYRGATLLLLNGNNWSFDVFPVPQTNDFMPVVS